MKTAKEMFEELGFIKKVYNDSFQKNTIQMCKYTDTDLMILMVQIDFSEYEFTRWYVCDFDYILKNTDLIHKAIHQQMKELGWLDE